MPVGTGMFQLLAQTQTAQSTDPETDTDSDDTDDDAETETHETRSCSSTQGTHGTVPKSGLGSARARGWPGLPIAGRRRGPVIYGTGLSARDSESCEPLLSTDWLYERAHPTGPTVPTGRESLDVDLPTSASTSTCFPHRTTPF